MTVKHKFSQKVLSVFLSIAVVLSVLPFSIFSAGALENEGIERFADPSTMDDWSGFFYKSATEFDTSNAGGIWTDKSVFKDNSAFPGLGVSNPSSRGFLTALSAVGSNMTITGESAVSTDTVFVLDTSGSMENNEETDIDAMVNAANTSIASLMSDNPNNRVAVVFFASDSVTFLPLDHYTTGTDGAYLVANHFYENDWWTGQEEYIGSEIALNNNVKNSSNRTPSASEREVDGGTYVTMGIYTARDILTSNSNVLDQTVSPRKPAIILMTDGGASYSHTNFTTPSSSNKIGAGNAADAGVVFTTELASSYAKEKITQKYGKDYACLFFTVGLGVSSEGANLDEAILDPDKKNTTAVNELWSDYNSAQVGDSVGFITTIKGNWNNSSETRSVTKLNEAGITLSSSYVNAYFPVDDAAGLGDAFENILSDIAHQTTYYPTLVSGGDAQHSGYISFVDKLGRYMQVDKLEGLIIDGELYTGSYFAAAFNEGDMGSPSAPTDLGDNLVWSIKQRLSIDADKARALLNSAYQAKQLYFNSESDFSNYFGWYSDKDNNFLGFYGPDTTLPEGAVYTNKSYLYLGEEDATTGIHASDMMYSTVRVRETIATGEQEVDFAIPASLVPTVSYNVELDINGNVNNITTNAETVSPIRLLYSTKLDDRINKWTANEVVDNAYKTYTSPVNGNNFTVNSEDGSINFYNNKWSFDYESGYGNYNPYSYFIPAEENDRYYYQNNTPIYTLTGTDTYTRYNEDVTGLTGEGYYYGTTVYYKDGNNVGKKTAYTPLRSEVLAAAQKDAEGWYIPATYVRREYADAEMAKELTPTDEGSGTLPYYAKPYSDFSQGNGSASHTDENHYLIVGTTLGNNGKITVNAETGIKITKQLEAGVNSGDKIFTFEIQTDNTALDKVEAYKLNADGQQDTSVTEVDFNSGKATVELKGNETIYIGGMKDGDNVTVKELIDTEYILKSVVVKNNGVASIAQDDTAEITLSSFAMPEAVFTNGTRGKGAVNVKKTVTHDYGANYKIPSNKFEIKVLITLEGKALTNYNLGDESTDASGYCTINLAHGESQLISGIPQGAVATVSEKAYDKFETTYNGAASHEGVTITAATANVDVVNDYDPTPASASQIKVKGIKNYDTNWKAGDSFTFVVQELIDDKWETLPNNSAATYKLNVETGDDEIGTQNPIEFEFVNVLKDVVYTAPGTYRYRVYEVPESVPGVNYDITNHRFEVTVADDNMSGALQITEVKVTNGDANIDVNNAQTEVTATFNNEYNTEDAIANITLNKIVENKSGSPVAENKLGGYTFQIMETDATFSQEGKTWDTISGETSSTGVLKHAITYKKDDVGKHYYLIREIDTRTEDDIKNGWIYDADLRKVVVDVSDGGGALLAKAYMADADNDAIAAATSTLVVNFTNKYEPKSDEIVIVDVEPTAVRTDFVKKQLNGRELKENQFKFVIKNLDSGEEYIGTNEAAADGALADVNFDKNLVFNAVGEYYFEVYEEIPTTKLPSVTYDTAKYFFTVTVTDNAADPNSTESGLKAVLTVDNGINNNNEVIFVNNYDAVDVDYSVTGEKSLSGKTLTANAFSFSVVECDQYGVALPGAETRVVYNDLNQTNNITFPQVTYTTAGTTNYLIWENVPTGEKLGINYDQSKYIATVEITDNPDTGKLEYGVTYKKQLAGKENWDVANKIIFNNSYSAAPAKVAFKGAKALEGKDLVANAYSFGLFESNALWDELEPSGEVKANGAPDAQGFGHFTFDTVELTEAKEYYFLAKEIIPTTEELGVKYDKTVFRIKVNVTDDGRGKLNPEIVIRTNDGYPVDDIVFNNTYAPVEGTKVTINGNKTLDKEDGTDVNFTDFTFTFELYEANDKYEINNSVAAIPQNAAADGKFSFEKEYKPEDLGKTFYYVIKEKDNDHGGVTYSEEEYRIKVEVIDAVKDGKLETKVTITDKNGDPVTATELGFVNNYNITETAKLTVSGSKTLEGRKIKANDFKFDIYTANSQGEITSSEPIKHANNTVKSDYVGEFTIKDIPLDKAGIHYFVLKEDSSKGVAKAGVTYDTTQYFITVTVKDDKDGTLSVDQITYERVTATETSTVTDKDISFKNTYKASASKPLNFNGKKLLDGRKLKDGEFTFILQETDEKFVPLKDTASLKAVNSEKGDFEFDALTFQKTGTYYYVISEDSTVNAERVTFDGTKYYATVTVTDDTDSGRLVAEYELKTDPTANKTVQVVEFNNIFTPKPDDIKVNLSVDKKVENKGRAKITAKGFSFLLEKVGLNDKLTAETDENGKAEFILNFSEDDIGKTYNYKLTEVNDNKPHIKYSDAEYAIAITITLNKDNKLVASITQNEKEVKTVSAEFINEYDYTPAENTESPKTGDISNINLWLALLFVSGGIITASYFGNRKKQTK